MKKILLCTLLLSVLSINVVFTKTNNKQMKSEKNYSVEIIRYNVKQDQHTDFENAYIAAGKYLKASPYCLSYQIIHGKDEPDNYIVIIHWTSKEEYMNGFRKSEQFMPFFNLVKPFYNNIQEMKHYDVTSNSWNKE